MAAADKFKSRRETSHIVAPTAQEKAQAIDSLFSSLGTAPPTTKTGAPILNVPQPKQITKDTVQKALGGYIEIFSTFGGGTILVDGKNQRLPYRVTSPIQMAELTAKYLIDTPQSVLRARRVK